MIAPAAAARVSLLSLLLIPCPGSAQDLDDYKGALAMGRKECTTASIPYEGIRDAIQAAEAAITFCEKCKNGDE